MDPASKTILLVEDDEDDIFILKRTAGQAQITNPIQIVTNGEEAMDYLAGQGKFADREAFPLPFLVLLDLKLPRVGGLETLKWIRSQPHLEYVSVVVLTSSAEERDIIRAYQLGARSYLVKPPTTASLLAILNALHLSVAGTHGRLLIEGEQSPRVGATTPSP